MKIYRMSWTKYKPKLFPSSLELAKVKSINFKTSFSIFGKLSFPKKSGGFPMLTKPRLSIKIKLQAKKLMFIRILTSSKLHFMKPSSMTKVSIPLTQSRINSYLMLNKKWSNKALGSTPKGGKPKKWTYKEIKMVKWFWVRWPG